MDQTPSSEKPSGRKTVRLSTTVPAALMTALEQRAIQEGRSLSNLVAFLLETSVDPINRS